ncbi:MAG: putative sterol carrier protein [Natronomonas sp.]|jgi:putative sterol carrier protein|uniref:hypothetical protein n=1 Tax=Natronomonas sp. TaxID=2184060 RepID=UPI003988E03F
MTDDIATRIEASLEASLDELESELPDILDDVDGQTRALVEEHPALFGRLVGRMEEIDIADFVSANPQTADQFQELLWTGMEVLVENTPEVKEQIAQNITVNFEANDCPMEGHLKVDGHEQTVTGGAGTIDDPTIGISGPGDNLVGLITGAIDPVQGFMSQQYELDGPVAQGTQLAPIMSNLAENIPS